MAAPPAPSAQDGFALRLDWGGDGARHLGGAVACLVVVDVLSFTTAVDVAVARGTAVYPCAAHGRAADALAARIGARVAARRRAATPATPWTLSPASLLAAPAVPRLVLPSPNGAAIASAARAPAVVAASLRNASAIARRLVDDGYGRAGRAIGVVPAGERWPGGVLRAALEDLLGAGAVAAALLDDGVGPASPEATAAATAFRATAHPGDAVGGSVSGRELVDAGYAADVDLAVQVDVSAAVPVLHDGAFVAAGG